jgi:AcrR family transcriptional regulator
MKSAKNPTRQRILDAALKLFATQGVTDTTTKQIAEIAEVNEVTLFRQFGNKHGLLLAVIEESAMFILIAQTMVQQTHAAQSLEQALEEYAVAYLQALEQAPKLVRSLIGEAGQYAPESRKILGRGFAQANLYVAEYFQAVIDQGQMRLNLPAEKLASLLHNLLFGYAVVEFTSEYSDFWQGRADFIQGLVTLFLQGAISDPAVPPATKSKKRSPVAR